jgi:hypothetical protein
MGIRQEDTQLPKLQFHAQQIFDIVNWAATHSKIDTTIGSLERAFSCSPYALHSVFAKGGNERKSQGRHFAVSAESDVNILAWITGKAEKDAAVPRMHIKNYCREVSKIEVMRGWVDSFISRHSTELIEKKSSPQGAPRLRVPRVFLDQTVGSMHDAVQGRPVDLVFNSISMKPGYSTGKTDNGRRWWSGEVPGRIRFIIDYLRACNISRSWLTYAQVGPASLRTW